MKKPIYKKWWVWIIVILVIGRIAGISEERKSGREPVAVTEVKKDVKTDEEKELEKQQKELEKQRQKEEAQKLKEEQAEKDKEEYIASAKTYKYDELERNPEKNKGEIAVFKGKVIQVSESIFNTVMYRVNIENDSGVLEDTIYVTYKRDEAETRILEDDTITIYGDLDGLQTYTSVLGNKISIPSVKAKYIIID